MAFTVMKDEVAIILDLHECGLKFSILVSILEVAVAAIEIRGIKRHDLLIVAIAQVEQKALERFDDLFQQFVAVCLLADDLIQRHGIGCIAVELLLVNIDARPDNAVAYMPLRQTVLNDGTTDLLVFPIDIVRPFDGDAVGVLRQYIAEGQCQCLRDKELGMQRHPHRMAEDGEEQVLAPFTLPLVRALPSTGCLKLRRDNDKVGLVCLQLSKMLGEISTCRVCLVKFDIVDLLRVFLFRSNKERIERIFNMINFNIVAVSLARDSYDIEAKLLTDVVRLDIFVSGKT